MHATSVQNQEMERFVVAVVLVAAVVVVALVVGRRRGVDVPSQPRTWPVPGQLDRNDFAHGDRPWLAALFTSASCDGCARLVGIAQALHGPNVGVQVIPWQEHQALHDRYGIEAVPCFVLADGEGVVRYGMVGSDISATDLWAAVAETREPGSTPYDPNAR
jgi:hypothetical protein